ncbi:MAG: protein kinase [Muribaculaceae bacterium]|nr:protein kinase [Muribaculaceae bacterium]
MKEGDVIHGYRILEDFRVVGGMSKVTFAESEGKEYFIKEFLSPKYPTPDSPGSERIKAQKRKACDTFESHHRKINELIATKVSLGGNLVYAVSFFREGPSYYKINEKIDTSSLSLKEISSLPFDRIITIARSVCHSVGILHGLNIVHGDLKPDNILIKETSRDNYTGKLIDFDDSYFSETPPSDRDRIVGTPEYYSPELAAYIMDEDEEIDGKTLTLASDIFTLGIIFCEYFTGEKPISGTSLPTWSAIAKGTKISFAKTINPEVDKLLRSMLSFNSDDRPSIKKIQNILREIKEGRKSVEETFGAKHSGSSIRIRLGRGFKPTSSEMETDAAVSFSPISDVSKSRKVGLRGKGLKIAEK